MDMPLSSILELRGPEAVEVYKALAHESRYAILELHASGDRNIQELGQALSLGQSTITKHVQQLEQAGLITCEYKPGAQGMQKRCHLKVTRLISAFEHIAESDTRLEEISMPIGLYTLANPSGICGLANRSQIIGFLDKPLSFYHPDRATAQILWMADGFVEYTFPNDLPTSMDVYRIELMMEVCSEAPDYMEDWPSDLTVWINGVEVGTWTSPGDFGATRGALNPEWWSQHMTQYGLLKIWSVDEAGTYVDGSNVSDVSIDRLHIMPQDSVSVRIGVKPDAEHKGGFNLFGSGFGNYSHDLILRLHYSRREDSLRNGEALDADKSSQS
jgi:predicted transcriptional regulator